MSNKGRLIAKIETFDECKINIDIGTYVRFDKSRQDTYVYCKEKGYKILSGYIGADKGKILIDFNCGHEPHWITPSDLKQNYGCPVCKESKGEKCIRGYLEKNNIEFEQECKSNNCKYKNFLRFDFYIPKYNLCVEFDGEQHYKARDFFGGQKSFELTQKRDKIKNKYCSDNKINLIRIPYWELENIDNILDEELDRLRELNNKTA